MATPHTMDVPSNRPSPERAAARIAPLDGVTKFALLTVAFGWFFMHTLVVTIGSLQHGVRFFDMTAVIADPTRLFFNVDTTVQRVAFGMVCVASLSAPVIASWRRSPAAWAYHLAPLILMVVCGAALYSKTSGEFFATPSSASAVSSHLVRLANNLARHGGDLVSRHISVAAGGYWAFAGCVLLGVQGIRRSRHR